jgi:hypothetical protein
VEIPEEDTGTETAGGDRTVDGAVTRVGEGTVGGIARPVVFSRLTVEETEGTINGMTEVTGKDAENLKGQTCTEHMRSLVEETGTGFCESFTVVTVRLSSGRDT